MNCNNAVDWLHRQGRSSGWRQATAREAQDMANQGKAAISIWKDPAGGHGHLGVFRPGQITDKGPAMAQAGSRNFNNGHVGDSFRGRRRPEYWVHD